MAVSADSASRLTIRSDGETFLPCALPEMLLAVVGGSYVRNVRPECVRETSSPDSTSSNTTSNLVTRSAFFTTRFDGDLLLVLGPEDLSIFRFGDFTGVEVDFLGGLNLIIMVKNKQTTKQEQRQWIRLFYNLHWKDCTSFTVWEFYFHNISKVFLEYFHTTENISTLWNWTKL